MDDVSEAAAAKRGPAAVAAVRQGAWPRGPHGLRHAIGNWPIRRRIFILVALGAAMFGLGIAIHLLGTVVASEAKEQERGYLAFIEETRGLELFLLRVRAAVEDLTIKQDPTSIDRGDQALKDARRVADGLAHGGFFGLFGDRLLEAGRNARDLAERVDNVVAYTLSLGLDDETGVRGRLRRSIRAVEEALATWPLNDIKVKLQEVQRFEYAYLLWRQDHDIGRFTKAAAELDFAISASTIPSSEQRLLAGLVGRYAEALDEFVLVAREQREARAVFDAALADALRTVTAHRETALVALGETIARHEATDRIISFSLYAAAVLALAAFVLVSVWVARSIYEPVLHIDSAMRRVVAGEGDLEIPEVERRDEIGGMARSIVKFRDALREVERIRAAERMQADELKLLAVAQAISSELSIDVLLKMIADAASDLIKAERTSLFLYDERTDTLFTKVAQGLALNEIRIPSSAGLAGSCFGEGKPINITDAQNDPRFNKEVDRRTGYRTRNILCMPVITKAGKRIGVLQVLNRKDGAFTEMDERRLSAFASQVSITLENAKLFQDVIAIKNYNESILRSLSNGVVTLDAAGGIVKLNEAAAALLGLAGAEAHGTSAGGSPGTIAQLLPADAWVHQSIEKVRKSGQPDLSVDQEIHPRDGAPSWVNLSVAPLIDTEGEAIGSMLVFEDISAEKRVKSTMARYISKEVMDKLLADDESVLGGVAQEVTVMFSDVRKFTTLTEALGPKGTVEMLNGYFTEMVDILISNGGTLDKYIGDAMMMLFGAPLSSGLDADNAVSAACGMMRAIRALNARRRAAGAAKIRIGLGIATGEVVAGNIGSPRRMEYTVIGDAVNLASRLEGATKHYGAKILLDDRTRSRLQVPVPLRAVDLIRVKGKTRPVQVFEALGHYDEGTFPGLDRFLPLYEGGLALYRARDFAAAQERFAAAAAIAPDDALCQLYAERARLYQATPPPESWDGVFTMTEK